MSGEAVLLLLGLFFGHFLGDFTHLATARMHHAKSNGGPLLDIAGHAAVHGALVAVVVAALAAPAWSIVAAAAAIELVTHFALDASRARLGKRYSILNDPRARHFWYALGFDQFAHGLVLVALAAIVLQAA